MKKGLLALVFVMLATLLHVSSLAQTEGGKIRLVTREVSWGKVHPGIVEESLLGSPDSNRFAYVAERGGKQFVVLDGVEGKKYDGIGFPISRYEPDDFEERDTRLHYRVWKLGYDIGLFVAFPEETITV